MVLAISFLNSVIIPIFRALPFAPQGIAGLQVRLSPVAFVPEALWNL